MYATSFDYHRASSLADAQRLLAATPGAKILAGGHSLLPLLKLRLSSPPALVDIGGVAELRGVTEAGGGVRIGALTTHADVSRSPLVRQACPVVADAAGRIGDPAVRNRGTIGGSIAHADPGADLPTVLVAIGARIEIAGASGRRTVDAADFFIGMMTTALDEDEIVAAVQVPATPAGARAAYEKFAHPASRYAVIGAAALVEARDGVCVRASVAVGGLTPKPTRLPSVESALTGETIVPELLSAAAQSAARDLGDDVIGDIFASAEYRRAVAPVYVHRALSKACG
jgi:carbon-monoxide dehydrogenase medium subunit